MSQAPQQSAAPDVQMPSKPPFWRDPEKRALVFQALALGFVFYLSAGSRIGHPSILWPRPQAAWRCTNLWPRGGKR